MPNEIRPEVYKRIVLAKALHSAGESACASRNDQMLFTKGILLLHDAAESVLGAIADQLGANLTGNRNYYLLDYYNLIKSADSQNRQVPYIIQMRNLNILRNNAKHQGILPDPKSNAHVPSIVYALIDESCQTYLGLDFSSVSLKSLIKNKEVLEYIEQAEKQIKNNEIEKGLISLAYAMYYICDQSAISWLDTFFGTQSDKKPTWQFPEIYKLEHTVRVLQNGVDPYLYYRFENLTPEVARHKDTSELSYWWGKDYGHPANWTPRNASFCLNFCIETALKFQREEDEGYSLKHYQFVYEDVIEPKGEEAAIWDWPSEILPQKPLEPRKVILTLKKGEPIIGWAFDYKDRLDEWYILSKNIPSRVADHLGLGYVSKEEVKVTRREIQIPQNSGQSNR